MKTKLRKLLTWVKLVLGSTLFALIVAELVLRFMWPVSYVEPYPESNELISKRLLHQASSVPGLSYELVPDTRKLAFETVIKTNHHGMRDSEPLPADMKRLVRMVALGDSFTFGFGAPSIDTYPNVLEKLLNDREGEEKPRFDVLNLGVAGYGTRDEVLVLEHKALAWNPHLILLGYVLNDPETDPIQPLQAYFATPHWWQHSHLLRLIAREKLRLKVWRLGGGNYIRYLHAVGHANWQSVVDAFERTRDVVADRKIPVIVLIFPRQTIQDWSEYPYRDLHAQVAAAARAAGLDVIDLLEPFVRHEPGRLRVASHDPHPSPLAHRLAAEAILAKLETEYPDILSVP